MFLNLFVLFSVIIGIVLFLGEKDKDKFEKELKEINKKIKECDEKIALLKK